MSRISIIAGCERPGPVGIRYRRWVYSPTGRTVWRLLDRRVRLRARLGVGSRRRIPNGYMQARFLPCRHSTAAWRRRNPRDGRRRRGIKGRCPAWMMAGYPLWSGRRSSGVYGR